jgi:NAD(P)-dependent dehydrogenase (short-subunit alcohol dehydrogenase family)
LARIFITGSSDGLGLLAGNHLAELGHEVVLHARNGTRADETRRASPLAAAVIEGDVGTFAGAKLVADKANDMGVFDAVLHNVGVGYQDSRRLETLDGVPLIFAVNVMAPYLLTALMHRPRRLVYLSSSMHLQAKPDVSDLSWTRRRWDAPAAYCESKLYDLTLAFAIARHWPDVVSNAVDPGWVPTRMGGMSAPDDLFQGQCTQSWLATSDDPGARLSGQYFRQLRLSTPNRLAEDTRFQDEFLAKCASLSGVLLKPVVS